MTKIVSKNCVTNSIELGSSKYEKTQNSPEIYFSSQKNINQTLNLSKSKSRLFFFFFMSHNFCNSQNISQISVPITDYIYASHEA